ncbi:MAG: hypothetical protein ABFR62_07420 [Bacteroidota bacterium]
MKKIYIISLLVLVSLFGFAQERQLDFMQNYMITRYPKFTFMNESTSALILVDGSKSDFNNLSSVKINQLNHLSFIDSDLTQYVEKYGSMAKKGVFLIETKAYSAKEWVMPLVGLESSGSLKQIVDSPNFDYSRLMIVVNGRELNTDFYKEGKIDPKSISDIKLQTFGEEIVGGMLTIETVVH